MNNLWDNILTIIWLNGAVLLVPGANFMLIVRHAATHGRRGALLCVLGITTAIMMHVVLAYAFVGYVLLKYKIAFEFIKYAGALYLLYLAVGMLRTKKQLVQNETSHHLLAPKAFAEGFLIDLLNPFVIFFYVSLLTTIIQPTTPISDVEIYFAIICAITIIWFMFVGVLFSAGKLRHFLMKRSLLLHRISGTAFIWFSYKLAIAQIS